MTEMESKPDKKYEYGGLREAERRKKERIEKRIHTQCPILKGMCKDNCVCYEALKVVNIGAPDGEFWDCQGGYCTCYALVGPTNT